MNDEKEGVRARSADKGSGRQFLADPGDVDFLERSLRRDRLEDVTRRGTG